MRILQISQDWFKQEFLAAGHEVVSCGADDHFDIRLKASLLHWQEVVSMCPWEPEVVMVYDNSVPVFISGMESFTGKILFYAVDVQHHLHWQKFLRAAFDHLFVAQKDYISQFHEGNAPIEWLPLWGTRSSEASQDKQYHAVFVGTLNPALNPERVSFFQALEQIAPVTCLRGEFWEIYPHAKVIVNQTVRDDLNFRVFEAMASGVPLVTDAVGNGLTDLFSDGVHLCIYKKGDPHDAASKIALLLGDEALQKRIGEAGRAEVISKHTSRQRAQIVLHRLAGTVAAGARNPYALVSNFTTLGLFLEREGRNAIPAHAEALRLIALGLERGGQMNFAFGQAILQSLSHYDRVAADTKAGKLLDALTAYYPEWFRKQ